MKKPWYYNSIQDIPIMNENQNAASLPNNLDAKRARFSDYAKDAIKSGMYGVLLAGMLGAAAMSVLQSEKTYKNVVQPTISEACAEPGSKQVDYRAKGLSVELVAGALLSHPKEIQNICATVNAAVGTYYVKNGNFLANNTEVYALVGALGVDAKIANAAIEHEGFKRAAETKKSEIQNTYGNSDSSGLGM